ncbi:hypothetical protein FSHL1_009979 [Fusarium sambucinum]
MACWFLSLWKCAAGEQAMNNSALAIDLVFPHNETYNPSPIFPIIFSYGDPGMIPIFEPVLTYEVWDYSNDSNPIHSRLRKIPLVNDSSSNPYIEFNTHEYPFNTEGTWSVSLIVRWAYCYIQPASGALDESVTIKRDNTFVTEVVFTTKGPLKQVDIGAATSNKTCPSPAGLTINAANITEVITENGFESHTCAFVDLPIESEGYGFGSLSVDQDRCAVTLEPATASSIDSSLTSSYCGRYGDDPKEVDCDSWRDSPDSTGLRLVAGGVTCLVFVLGVITYIHNLM